MEFNNSRKVNNGGGSNSESGSDDESAYSPHTSGFPPTSHSPALSNPFALRKARIFPTPLPPSSPTHSSSLLRPSKLEAPLSAFLHAKNTPDNLTTNEGGGKNTVNLTTNQGGALNLTTNEGGAKNTEGGALNLSTNEGGVIITGGGALNLLTNEGGGQNGTGGGATNLVTNEKGARELTSEDGVVNLDNKLVGDNECSEGGGSSVLGSEKLENESIGDGILKNSREGNDTSSPGAEKRLQVAKAIFGNVKDEDIKLGDEEEEKRGKKEEKKSNEGLKGEDLKATHSAPPEGFLFGSNLNERVENVGACKEKDGENGENGSGENTQIKNDDEDNEPSQPQPSAFTTFVFGSNLSEKSTSTKAFSNGDHSSEPEVAGTSMDSATKRKWESTALPTGEEDESNVLQASCRLFTFDSVGSNWVEKGRGLLRLNDRKEGLTLHSRLIIRTKGSLRLMLNTPVFPSMLIERSSEKCIKITGQEDESTIRVFLIQCSPPEAETLYTALDWRRRQLSLALTSAPPGSTTSNSTSTTPTNESPNSSSSIIQQSVFELDENNAPVSSDSPPKKQKFLD